MTLADHHRKTVSRGGTSPRYLATSNGAGHLVYLNKSTLFAVPFDLDKLETRGTAFPVLDDVASNGMFGAAQFFVLADRHFGVPERQRGQWIPHGRVA